MKINKLIIILLAVLLLLSSCGDDKILGPSDLFVLSDSSSEKIPDLSPAAGKYELLGRQNITCLLNFSNCYLFIHFSDLTHAVLKGESTENGVLFSGYTKPMLSAANFVPTEIFISSSILEQINKNNISPDLKLDFRLGDLTTELKFSTKIEENEFMIFGHRGGGTMGFSIPAPENSLEIIGLSSVYGANGVEVDIMLTKDKIPILFHDENITPRTVESQIVMGRVEDYYYSHIEYYCRLYNGEKIPTLEQALEFILHETKLKYVWLDCKTNEIESILLLQREYNQKAVELNRDLIIYIGLPDEDVWNAYMNSSLRAECPSICELSPEKTLESESKLWSQRWTQGINTENIDMLLKHGIKTVFWPVNDREVIKDITDNTKANGVITDYPQYIYFIINE